MFGSPDKSMGAAKTCPLTQGVASLALGYELVGLCLSASRRRPLVQPVLN